MKNKAVEAMIRCQFNIHNSTPVKVECLDSDGDYYNFEIQWWDVGMTHYQCNCKLPKLSVQTGTFDGGQMKPGIIFGGKYNFKNQHEQLVYIGKTGSWHQFEKMGEPGVWAEVLDRDLYLIEESVLRRTESLLLEKLIWEHINPTNGTTG